MKLTQFLQSSSLTAPIERKDGENLYTVLKRRIDKHIENVTTLEKHSCYDKEKLLDELKSGSELLLASLELALRGRLSKAYSKFEKGIVSFKPQTDGAIRTISDLAERPSGGERPISPGILYRMRCSKIGFDDPNELFHIPFEQRHLVGSKRFSIPGVPCLYTAGSSFACWEEMGRPAFNELHVCALWKAKQAQIKYLDLRWSQSIMALPFKSMRADADLDEDEHGKSLLDTIRLLHLAHFIKMWPLIALCTVKVKRRNSSFIPEYLVPQMVMEWVGESEDIDGVAYLSTHIPFAKSKSIVEFSNYAFPAKKIMETGYCSSLSSKFHQTAPRQWSLFNATRPKVDQGGNFEFNIIPELPLMYGETDFGLVDSVLLQIARVNDVEGAFIGGGRASPR